MQLLSEFPEIVATKVHPYEIRAAQYWSACFRTLSSDADYTSSSRPNFFHRQHGEKWIGAIPFITSGSEPHQKWLKEDYKVSLKEYFKGTIQSYYESEALAHGKSEVVYFCEKAPYVSRGTESQDADVIDELFEEVKTIYLTRDPLDILVSQLNYNKNRDITDDSATERVTGILAKHMDDMANDFAGESAGHAVKYEDLISDPLSEIVRICDFLQLSPQHAEQIIVQAGKKTVKAHITSGSVSQSVQRWKTELTPSQIDLASRKMARFIDVFGYSH